MKNAIHGAAWPICCLVALLLICTAPVGVHAAPEADADADGYADVYNVRGETCLLECGKVLADCERQRPRGAHCARDYQMCRGDCSGENRQPLLDAKQRRLRLCHQRCELSTALCEQDTAQQQKLEHCTAGVSQCKARC